ncbi:MAG: hypothetical protein PHO80_05640 [Candidatus Gracilibacteria bacterium]|nr:hypothetical protein [Candidatus Gracilibacteria bacterium]
MNDFYKKKPYKTYTIDVNNDKNLAKNLTKNINKDFPPNDKEKFNILYIYYLADQTFKYPNNSSNVLYIGNSVGELNNGKTNLGFRFKHCLDGHDSKQNICLSNYYKKAYIIGLDVFDLSKTKQRAAEEEKKLRYKFLNQYGALPIADGANYKKI